MKKLITMTMVMAAGLLAFADGESYLYWMIDPAENEWSQREFDYAYLTVTDQGGSQITDSAGDTVRLSLYDSEGAGPFIGVASDETRYNTMPVYAALGNYASSSFGFMVEAYLEGDILAWTGQVGFYDQLLAKDHIWNGKPSAMSGDITPWATQVPEPNSAALLLLGLASLALRRRKVEKLKG